MAEGKTLDAPSIKCESCEEADSAKFCIECNQPMCTKCIRIHGRVAASKTHNFIPLEDYKLLASSSKGTATSAYCAKHHQKIINKICEDCLVVLCSECESDHKGHKLNSGSFDANFLHRVSAQKVPGLLEIIQELKDLEDGSPEKIRLYKEAERLVKSWKDQLLDVITKDADRLLGDIRGEIKKHEQMLATTSAKIKECIVKTDHQITRMSESRKISDTTKLLDQMSKCDKEVDDIKSYIEKIKLSQEKQTIQDILPYKDEFQKAVKTVKHLFTKANKDIPARDSFPGDYRNVARQKQRNYNNLELLNEILFQGTNGMLRLCNMYQQANDQIVVFELTGKNIYIYNSSLTKTKTHTFSKSISKMAMVNAKGYVIVGHNPKNIYITNRKFEIQKSIARQDSEYEPHAVCVIGIDKCVISECNKKVGTTRLTEINLVEHEPRCKIVCEKNMGHASSRSLLVNHNGLVAISDSINSISTLNLQTGEITKVYTSQHINLCMCSDGENLLIGTEDGYVFTVIKGQSSSTILKGFGNVKGLQVMDSGVVVLLTNKMQMYQPQ